MKQRRFINRMPRLRKLIHSAKIAAVGPASFESSASYWEERYRYGGNSGAGSYNRLAEFKAGVLNQFVATHGISDIIEFGSGDGAQLGLAKYPRYTGVDVSHTAVAASRQLFAENPSIRFLHTSEYSYEEKAPLALSLDVIYHLVEDDVFHQYMHRLFNAATRYVIIYSSNEEKASPSPHLRHRKFTSWVEANRTDFALVQRIPNAYPYSEKNPDNTSFADFYIFERQL